MDNDFFTWKSIRLNAINTTVILVMTGMIYFSGLGIPATLFCLGMFTFAFGVDKGESGGPEDRGAGTLDGGW